MEEKRIEMVKTWPEPQLVKDIQVFLGFANFYKRFIKNFSKIVAALTSMLWTTNKTTSNKFQSNRDKDQDALGARSAGGAGGVGKTDGLGRDNEDLSNSRKLKKRSKSNPTGTDFLTSGAKKIIIYLQKAFTEVLILRYFDPKCYIQIETDASGYAIDGVLS